jgi:hypothetical protein
MLIKDPFQRIGMREIFEHPWIEQYRAKKQHKGNILSRAVDDELNDFEEE